MKLCEPCKTQPSCREATLCAKAEERCQREEDDARDALWKDGFLNGVAWRQANPDEPWDAAEKAAESYGSGVAAAPPARRDVPPGKWKVDMPDGTYGKMPGDPPGPASVRAVIGGYVYDVEPRTGRLRAAAMQDSVHLPPAGDEEVTARDVECHGLDTPERVCFYEQDFYVLSNFSSFSIYWSGLRFDTSEHLYHWLKFNRPGDDQHDIRASIRLAPSAHEAFKIAERNKQHRRADWDEVKVEHMRDILRAKVAQHEYVRRKLLATGDRELVENSWRDDFWGWGPNRSGQNMLGKLWMEVRAELRAAMQEPKP